jgi:hypothetical protein
MVLPGGQSTGCWTGVSTQSPEYGERRTLEWSQWVSVIDSVFRVLYTMIDHCGRRAFQALLGCGTAAPAELAEVCIGRGGLTAVSLTPAHLDLVSPVPKHWHCARSGTHCNGGQSCVHRYAYLLGTNPEQLLPSLSAGMYLLLKVGRSVGTACDCLSTVFRICTAANSTSHI